MENLGSFILAALALTGSPGPNTLSLAAVGAAYGRSRGFAYMVGLNLGVFLVIAIVGSGISGILFALPGVAPVVTIVAALYFVYLAWRIATASPIQADAPAGQEPKWYEGMGLSLVNPKAYAAMAALFSSFVLIEQDPLRDGMVKAGVLIADIMFVNICWLSAGAALTTLFRHERHSRTINVIFAVILIVSVAATLFL